MSVVLTAEQNVILSASDRSRFALQNPQDHYRTPECYPLEECPSPWTFCLGGIFWKNCSTSSHYLEDKEGLVGAMNTKWKMVCLVG